MHKLGFCGRCKFASKATLIRILTIELEHVILFSNAIFYINRTGCIGVIFILVLDNKEYIFNKTECIMIFVDHQTITLDDVSLIIQKRRKYLTHEFLCQS